MPTLSGGDLTLLRTWPQMVTRHLSFAPRTAVFAAQVNGPAILDTATGGIVQIAFNNVTLGSYTAALAGLSLDIGSAPGLRDVGTVRLRQNATSTHLFVAETASARLTVADDYYLTVRNERRLWQKLPYLAGVKSSGSSHYDSFTVYKDYDVAYSAQNLTPPPLACIEGEIAGWVDSGQTYRTVLLTSARSAAVPVGGFISSYLWGIVDGTLVAGYALTDSAIEVRFPATTTFRYISLTVTDNEGQASTRWFPIFVHDAAHPPLDYSVGFQVDRDDTADGREMSFTIWGDADAADETVIPEGTLVVYWEEALFNEQAAPAQYRRQFMGWVARDSTLLKLYRSQYSIDVLGPAGWLDRLDGPQESMLHAAAPSTWYEMAGMSDDRLIAYLLRYHTTFLDICNLYLSGVISTWSKAPINRASIWRQVQALAGEMLCAARCDSAGNLHVVQQACYLSNAGRYARAEVLTLTAQDWTDEEGLTVTQEKGERVGLVIANGFSFDGVSISVPYRSHAPGLTPGPGAAQETMPGALCLPMSGGQSQLNEWAGNHLARLNNPCPDLPLTLLGNLDIAEPAWGEWIQLSYSGENVRGLALDGLYLLKQVSTQHSRERGAPPKRLTWTLEKETMGQPGVAVPIEDSGANLPAYTDPSTLYPQVNYGYIPQSDYPTWMLGAIQPDIAGFNSDGYLYLTANFSTIAETASWARASLGVSGTPLEFCVDAFSPKYLGSGTAVNGWLVTTSGIYYIEDIAGAGRSVTLQKTFDVNTTEATRSIDFNFAAFGKGLVVTHYQANGTYVTYTTDGTTWSAEAAINTNTETDSDFAHRPGLYASTHQPGTIYTAAFSTGGSGAAAAGDIYKSIDYGAAFALEAGYQCQDSLAEGLHVPFHDNASDTIVFYGKRIITGAFQQTQALMRRNTDTTHTDVSPTIGGRKYGRPEQRWGISTCPTNCLRVILCGRDDTDDGAVHRAVFVSPDAGANWTTIVADATGNQYNRAAIAGDDEDVLYLWGMAGLIAYSADFGDTISDRRGNLTTMDPAPGTFIGICGV